MPPDEPQQGKTFRGAWLELDGGEHWVIDYSPASPFRELRDQRVRVEGERYTPEGLALVAPHLRVTSLTALARDAPYVWIGREQEVVGRFEDEVGARGTLLEGETIHDFVSADGKRYLLAHTPDPKPALGQKVTLRVRLVEPSPYAQRLGGAYLWVLQILE